ncbi:helix-turn-helix domain-containing protein [Heyndrickxia acidicola]|uniref:Helix-turn-helix transcriptional regulator n=1 Tax=Heyndrickxia acidicola TaxID=209389 RepID=A0ABU6MD39_9BACI|nr:helix-turn-helix transcriptional regulator [Heyndrickxia acidicola]MED1202583.1 helix-turn-helix transcriptional regulator [Heyndrickxia acidicola]
MSEVNDVKEDTLMKSQEEETKLEYEVAQQIISLRKSLGLSQKELAEKLNTRQSAISRIEKGEQNISIGLLEKIADALGGEVKVSLNLNQQDVPAATVPSSQVNSVQPGGQVNPIGGTYQTVSRQYNNNVY